MNAAGTAQPEPDTITGVLKSSAVSGAAAVAMQKNSAGSPSALRLRRVVRPSGLATTAGGSTDARGASEVVLIAQSYLSRSFWWRMSSGGGGSFCPRAEARRVDRHVR